jgi:hypothetical protein
MYATMTATQGLFVETDAKLEGLGGFGVTVSGFSRIFLVPCYFLSVASVLGFWFFLVCSTWLQGSREFWFLERSV